MPNKANHLSLLKYVQALFKKETPTSIKLLSGATLLYMLSPVDFIPEFLGPMGFLDDAFVMGILTTAGMSILNHYLEQNPNTQK